MKMSLYEKVVIGIGALAVALMPPILIAHHKTGQSIQMYVETNLTGIINSQEETLGINHFGLPEIKFKYPDGMWYDKFVIPRIGGAYDPAKDIVYLPTNKATIPESNFTSIWASVRALGNAHNIKETTDHESGHYYADKLSENLGRGSWPDFQGDELSSTNVGLKLISEGIAEYFRREINGGKDDFKESDWPKNLEDFLDEYVIYSGGYHLVKPIIDKHGKKGIEYLITNPLSGEDLMQLPEYQSRALRVLLSQVPEL